MLVLGGTSCTGNDGKKEQMVNLKEITDNPEAQLASLNAAIQTSKQQANLYARRAMLYLREQELGKALADASEAVRLSGNAPENLFLKAQVLRAMKREGEALQLALQAERNGFENELLYVLLTDLYFQLGQYHKAKQYNNLAYKLSATDAYVLYYRGRLAAVSGDTAVAVKNYRQALKDAPGFFELNRELAGLYVAGKDSAQAHVSLNRAKALESKDGMLWYYQGEQYQHVGKKDSAIWSYRKAIGLADTLVAAHHQLGYMLYAQGNYGRASKHLEKASGKYGKSVRFLTTLAGSYERTGQEQKALEQYEKLVKLEPAYSYAHQKVARLKSRLAKTVDDSTSIRYYQ